MATDTRSLAVSASSRVPLLSSLPLHKTISDSDTPILSLTRESWALKDGCTSRENMKAASFIMSVPMCECECVCVFPFVCVLTQVASSCVCFCMSTCMCNMYRCHVYFDNLPFLDLGPHGNGVGQLSEWADRQSVFSHEDQVSLRTGLAQ